MQIFQLYISTNIYQRNIHITKICVNPCVSPDPFPQVCFSVLFKTFFVTVVDFSETMCYNVKDNILMWCYVEKTETVEQQSKTTKEKEMIYYGKEKGLLCS